jgi:hypothetical protein
MTTLREAAQQALEAWEHINLYGFVLADYEGPMEQAITALRAALEQPEQEPVTNNPDPYHLSRILHELAGSASMCWEHVDRAGAFQSTQAADVVTAALAEIRQRMKDAPPRRECLHAEVNELKRTLALQQQSYEREIQIEVEAEREACAKLFDGPVWSYDYREIAAAIRARGQV